MSSVFAQGGQRLHLVRYGTSAEQRYLLGDFLGTYDMLVINANMVSHTPAALAAFVAEKAGNKRFIIDPQTHAFQHDIALLQSEDDDGKTRLRKSIERLVEAYGDPVASSVSKDSVVLPEDFHDTSVRRTFAERVGRFQLDVLRSRAEEKGFTEYYDFVGAKKAVTPVGVVAPYFFMELTTLEQWLPTNRALIDVTSELYGSEHEVYAQLVIAADILEDPAARKKIADHYADAPVNAVLLWIDNFSEHSASPPLLESYVDLVKTIGVKKPVVMLYGSFFSTALMRYVDDSGLAGVCHGLEYGEDRSVVPAVGGLPVSKFYYPELHRRVRFADAYKMARPHLTSAEDFLDNVCRCGTCKKVLTEGPSPEVAFALYGKSHPVTFRRRFQVVTLNYPDTDTHDRCVQHYMWNKQWEFNEATNLSEICNRLEQAATHHQRILGLADVSHCKTWATILNSLTHA